MAQTLYLNVLDPQYTRYVQLGEELKQSLIEMYGDEIDFQICVSEPQSALEAANNLTRLKHESDRWSFYAPDELDPDEIRYGEIHHHFFQGIPTGGAQYHFTNIAQTVVKGGRKAEEAGCGCSRRVCEAARLSTMKAVICGNGLDYVQGFHAHEAIGRVGKGWEGLYPIRGLKIPGR